MARARIVEVDYHQFMAALRNATESDGQIEPSNKQQWKVYVRQHDVKEASCMSYARARTDKVAAAIINDGGPWDGYYVYSKDEEFCLKFVPAERGEPAPSGDTAPPAADAGEPAAQAEAPAPEAEAPAPEAESPAADAGDAPAEGPGEEAGGSPAEEPEKPDDSEPPKPA